MKKLIFPGVLCLLSLIVYMFLRDANFGGISEDGYTYLLTFFYACLSIVVVRAAGLICFDVIYVRRTRREAPELLRLLFSLPFYGICLTLIFSLVLHKDLTGILATSAVLSVVLGLALQDTLSNFFAGTSLHMEQQFQIGDSIKIGNNVGKVETVSWRTTTIRTNNNTIFTFPNSLIAREQIEIYHYLLPHRVCLDFTAPYAVPPGTVIQVVQDAARNLPDVTYEIAPKVRISGFGDSAINYELLYWTHDKMHVQDINAHMRERIWYAFHRNDIEIPFPVRHLLVERRAAPSPDPCLTDYRRVLACIDIFEPLTQPEKDEMLTSNNVSIYAPGECMVCCGDPGESMFVIGRGKAEVRVPVNGTVTTVAVLEEGDFFGEMSLFSGEPRSADVVAIEEIDVLEIHKSSIQKLLLKNNKLAEAFSRKVTERRMALAEHADSLQSEELEAEQGKLLQRIMRFFNLG